MSERINDLLSGWLDGAPENPKSDDESFVSDATRTVAESLLMHGLLTDLADRDNDDGAEQVRAVMQRIDAESESNATTAAAPRKQHSRSRFAILASALTIAAAVMIMFFVFSPNQSASAAMASLEKVVEAAMRPLDRTYHVRLVEEYSRDKRPRNLSREVFDREAPEQIDGATIYVRSTNEYVMTVLLKTGITRTSGCDGKLSWSFREDGPVHVSDDLNRFRGGMPGNKQDMPFLNIHASLSKLTVGYNVEVSDTQDSAADGTSLSKLACFRKSNDVRGMKRVDVWFDPDNGTVHRMLLDGLPRGRGGPKSVMLTLIDQSDLGVEFFAHQSHHEPERSVKRE